MTTIEHPGWKEFPLASAQPVRAIQINALWWSLNERAQAVAATDIIETNFPEIEKGRNSQESAADALTIAEAQLTSAEVLLAAATTAAQTTAAQQLIDDANDAIDTANDDIDEASELSESEIDDENAIIEDQFKTDKMNIFRGAGEDVINLTDLLNLRAAVIGTLILFMNPEQIDADEDGEIEFTFRTWTISTILKKIKIESETIVEDGGTALSFGGPIDPSLPEEDQIFALTGVPDRPDDTVIIGPGPAGEADDQEVDFNILFGPASFGIIPSRTPMFRDHFNEIYEIIKCLKFIPITSANNNDNNIVNGTLLELTDFDSTQFDDWIIEYEADRADLIGTVGSGGEGENTGSPAIPLVNFGNALFAKVDRLTGKWRHDISYNISNNLRVGDIPPTGEFAPTPFEYGENLVAVSYSTLDFIDNISQGIRENQGGNPAGNEVILKIIIFTDESGEGVDDFGDDDIVQSVQTGERIFDAQIEGGHPDLEGPDTVTDDFFTIPNSLIPTGDRIEDTEPQEFNNEFGLNMYAGEEFTFDLEPPFPENVSSAQNLRAEHGGTFIGFRGFVEITNWIHVTRDKEAQPANEASELAVFVEV